MQRAVRLAHPPGPKRFLFWRRAFWWVRWRSIGPGPWRLGHEAASASHRSCARHDANLGLVFELLPAGHPGRSDRARPRGLLELDICRLLGLAGDFGDAGPPGRPAD